MADINVKANVQRTSTLGKVRILVEQVVGNPTQAQISQAVADYIGSHPGALSPLSQATKSAMLDIAAHVAYIDANGQDYYDALDAALNAKALLSITAVFNTGGVLLLDTDITEVNDLKPYLTVTAEYDDGTSAPVTDYTLSGNVSVGINEITVSYGDATARFSATIYHNYANQTFTQWAAGTGVTKTASQITLKTTQSNANAWKCWTADKSTLWGTVKGKKMRMRVTLYSPDWTGEISETAPLNKIYLSVGAYSSTASNTLNGRTEIAHIPDFIFEGSEPKEYELDFTAETDDASVTDSYHFGIYMYNASANTVILSKAELFEVYD